MGTKIASLNFYATEYIIEIPHIVDYEDNSLERSNTEYKKQGIWLKYLQMN